MTEISKVLAILIPSIVKPCYYQISAVQGSATQDLSSPKILKSTNKRCLPLNHCTKRICQNGWNLKSKKKRP